MADGPARNRHRSGVLRGRPIAVASERHKPSTPHYHILVETRDGPWRVSVSVRSVLRSGEGERDSLLLAAVIPDFRHPHAARWIRFSSGFSRLPASDGSGALDYVRGGLVEKRAMRLLPHHRDGDGNDLSDALDALLLPAIDEAADLFAFGRPWGPERREDFHFGFVPGRGIHNIHMNQGSPPDFFGDDNGVWQDGGLILHYPREDRWAAVFLAFQSQSWRTDDRTGYPR